MRLNDLLYKLKSNGANVVAFTEPDIDNQLTSICYYGTPEMRKITQNLDLALKKLITMYRITYEQGNGYSCGCCRRTSEQTIDLNTIEEVQDWIDELYASFKFPKWEDDDDRELISIEKEIGVDIKDQFTPNQKKVDEIIAERQKEKDEKENKKEELKRQQEYDNYLKLKQKFE